jgi:outer membrane receptor for ferrienterochelin and colicins
MARNARAVVLLMGLATAPSLAHAQDKNPTETEATGLAVTGKVAARKSGAPVEGVTVLLIGTDHVAVTDSSGRYALQGIAPGTYTVQAVAYANPGATAVVKVEPGQRASSDLVVDAEASPSEVIVVTGSRAPEKVLDAPATLHTVSQSEIEEIGGATWVSRLGALPGVDLNESSLADQRVSMRGFNDSFNTRVLQMVDNRISHHASSGIALGAGIPVSELDMKSLEVVIGASSALYGANAHSGVINIITKTPWDESGVRAMVAGGQRGTFNGTVRAAGTVARNFGWKVNAKAAGADDFRPPDDPAIRSHHYNSRFHESELIGDDYGVNIVTGDANLYFRKGDWFARATYGASRGDGFVLTNTGRIRLLDSATQVGNVQVSHPRWFFQASLWDGQGGNSYSIDGLALAAEAETAMGTTVDESELARLRQVIGGTDDGKVADSEVQTNVTLGPVRVIVGSQVRMLRPDSAGTYLDDAVTPIEINQWGAYTQLDYHLLEDKLRLLLGARLDTHTDFPAQFSPRAAAVYHLADQHRLRVGVSRAFKSPTIVENYLLVRGFARGNRDGYVIEDMDGNRTEIEPLVPEQVTALELGYKGPIIGNKLFAETVVHQSWYRDFISALTLVAAGPGDGRFAYEADGVTPTAPGTPFENWLLTYFNFGRAVTNGADAGLIYLPRKEVLLETSASLIRVHSTTTEPGITNPLVLNVPALTLKGAITVHNLGVDNYFVRLATRFRTAHDYESGYWSASRFYPDDGKVPQKLVADLSAGYHFDSGITLRGFVRNLLNNRVPDMLGSPIPGRLGFVQLEYVFGSSGF